MSDQVPNPWLNDYFKRFRQGGSGWQPTRPLDVCFVVGNLALSGGTNVIIEHARFLQRHGANVTFVALEQLPPERLTWRPELESIDVLNLDDVVDRTFDIAIATWWATVYQLPRLRFRHAAYLVLSIESRFYSHGADYANGALAELTYTFGLPCIVVARWMEIYLALEHHVPSFLVRSGIAKDRYSPDGFASAPREPGRVRALIEGTLDVPMKGVQESIELCQEAGFDEIWLMTPTDIDQVPGVDRVFSHIPADETAAVYRSADVLVKLSQVEGMYGPPLEMFHCGGTVVTWDVTGCEEYVIDGVNGLVCEMGNYEQLRLALSRVASDRELLAELKSGALRTAQTWPDWEAASQHFYAYVFGIASGVPVDSVELTQRIAGAPKTLSIMREEHVRAGRDWMEGPTQAGP